MLIFRDLEDEGEKFRLMKRVMISGHFDPFHFVHLDFIKRAAQSGDFLIVVVSSDKQAILKKGKANEPASARAEILDLILRGLEIRHRVFVNTIQDETTYVSKVLEYFKPDIFIRGSDKTIDDMPEEEKEVCERLGIEILHVRGKKAHGSEFV